MGLKFTDSQDGTPRTNIRITLRFSEEDLKKVKEKARQNEYDWRTWLEQAAFDGIYGALLDEDGSYEQHYGKGEGA